MARARVLTFDDVTKTGVLSDLLNVYWATSRGSIFFMFGSWIGFFFLSLLGNKHQILHIP